jgi:hypothetical protein
MVSWSLLDPECRDFSLTDKSIFPPVLIGTEERPRGRWCFRGLDVKKAVSAKNAVGLKAEVQASLDHNVIQLSNCTLE